MSMEQSTLGERRTPAVFITGAGGEVGHGLISSLSEDGKTDIVATDLRELEAELRKKCAGTYLADVCDQDGLDRILSMYQVKEIYHLAAQSHVGESEADSDGTMKVNVQGTENLLQCAQTELEKV